ncbi:hypothetical protein HRG84_24330 [Flavisolibacter sp. BT320]|nr:hypothetical protein [Flavisolibacter longurius]
MPTIEIISIDAPSLDLIQDTFQVALIEESILTSHRGLFYEYLQCHRGTIVHMGNPDFIEDKKGGFFAGQLIDWNFEPFIQSKDFENSEHLDVFDPDNQFQFLKQYKPDIEVLMSSAIQQSLVKRAFFLTDYQFGPDKGVIKSNMTIKDFWQLHDSKGLAFNTLYEVSE